MLALRGRLGITGRFGAAYRRGGAPAGDCRLGRDAAAPAVAAAAAGLSRPPVRCGWFSRNDDDDDAPKKKEDDRLYLQKRLFQLYKKHVVPLERRFSYAKFATPELNEADFLAPPMVLLLGQYSTGKTSAIEYLVGRSVPGAHTGPEPTTDKFTAVMYGDEERRVPGHAAASDETLPFQTLTTYGSQFLSKFEVASVPSPVLKDMTFVDTPGVLSGEKQRQSRGYDFAAVTQHLASRADRILLLFDCSKLDISDEFKDVIKSLDGNRDKMRCVLNKADQVGSQELFRVYGALLWSLGKVMMTPEVLRVFVGSLRDGPYTDHPRRGQGEQSTPHRANHALFDLERAAVLADLRALPAQNRTRRINETVKRFHAVKAHALLCSHLQRQFGWLGKAAQQGDLLRDVRATQHELAKQVSGLSAADFLEPDAFRRTVEDLGVEMWEWEPVSEGELAAAEKALHSEIHALLHAAGQEEETPGEAESKART